MSEIVWNEQQQEIFREIEGGQGHAMVKARAGTGKTTTCVEATRRIPSELTLMTAFNKRIADELQRRLPNSVDAKTLHALGLKALRQIGDFRVDGDKGYNIAKHIAGERAKMQGLTAAIKKGATLCKSSLIETEKGVEKIIDSHDLSLDPLVPDEELARMILSAMEIAKKGVNGQQYPDSIDFDDMVWLPVVYKVRPRRAYQRIFVDEVQDMSAAQLDLAMSYANKSTRFCLVGDPAQAIYSWRGADGGRMGTMSRQLGARELPLTITYRCAKAIVREAQKYVRDLQAAPDAPEGIVREVRFGRVEELAKPGDFVLSRTNAPLVRTCLQFIRANKRTTIQGRDLGDRIYGIVRRIHDKAPLATEMLKILDEWKQREIKRRIEKDLDTGYIVDLCACIETFAEDLVHTDEVLERIKKSFSEGDEADYVVLSTTHRAKGLERDRVFVLADTFLRRRPSDKDVAGKPINWSVPDEERNLMYCAITRAKNELVFVKGTPGED